MQRQVPLEIPFLVPDYFHFINGYSTEDKDYGLAIEMITPIRIRGNNKMNETTSKEDRLYNKKEFWDVVIQM